MRMKKRDLNKGPLVKLSSFYQVTIEYLHCISDEYLYALVEDSDIRILFTYKEFAKLNKDLIYYKDIKDILS